MADAGYSGTPQLGIGPGRTWDVVDRPAGWDFAELPDPASRAEEGT